MLLRLCQIKSLSPILLLVTVSCGLLKKKDEKEIIELLSNVTPVWFTKNNNHALFDRDEKPQSHLFFDVKAELSSNAVNAIVLTPAGSEYAYALDLASGRRYFSHAYCPQADVWSRFSGTVWKPTFSIGVIPGYLDQLGDPQKVLIFGNTKKYRRLSDNYYHRVRLVGAYIEQICPEGNCLGKSNWLSKLVFIAVDPDDEKLAKITELEALKKTLDWEETVAVIENIEGRNGSSNASYPAIRMGQTIDLPSALTYYTKNSIQMTSAEIEKIQKNCQSIYEKLWKDVGEERPEDRAAKTSEELREKVKLRDALKKKKLPVGFAARLKLFTKKYYPEITTCQRFVYAGNINHNPERYWFLSQINMFFKLNKDGYYFDCNSKSWLKNYQDSEGEWVYDLKRNFMSCSDKEVDTAFNYMPNFINGLKGTSSSYYRFVDYDNHTFGSHGKLYSWVKIRGRTMACSHDPNEDIRREMNIYPEDMIWKPRDVKDIGEQIKIIY